MKYLLTISILLVASCEFLAADLESDPRWVAAQVSVQEQAASLEALAADNEALYNQLREEGVTAATVAATTEQLAANFAKIQELNALQGQVKIDLEAIAAEHAVPEWQLWAGTAASALIGMGIPTSGPLAGLLGGLGPVLESFGVRNRRKRRTYHTERDQDAPIL